MTTRAFFAAALLALTLPAVSSAKTPSMTVEQIYQEKKQVVVRSNGQSLSVGQEIVITLDDGTQCATEIRRIEGNHVLATFTDCPQATKIRKGDRADLAIFDEDTYEAPIARAEPKPKSSGNLQESWYTYWGVGLAIENFNDSTTKGFKDRATESDTTPMVDLLGFYLPSSHLKGWLFGFVLNYDSTSAREKVNNFVTSSIGINQSLYAFSNYYFLRQEIGSGFFVRADLGLALTDVSTFDSNTGDKNDKSYGAGGLVGIGGAMPLTEGTRALVQLTYKKGIGGKYDVPVTGISFGLML